MKKDITSVIGEHAKTFRHEIRSRMGLSIAAAFAFVIGLTWNEVIKEFVTQMVNALGLDGQTIVLKFAAAILTTIVCILGIKYFSMWQK